MNKTIIFFSLLLLSCFSSFAQRGFVTGVLFEEGKDQPLIGGTVMSTTCTGGGFSDKDGRFKANLATGPQTLSILVVGYETKEIKDVVVPDGGTIDIGNVYLKSSVMNAVVIRAKKKANTEASIIAAKRKSVNLMVGTSAQAAKDAGDGDAAAAIKRVTGISVEAGKYVFVRGLGDRYSKTVLNGMELPGLDPDKNTVQMDIFPTSLIDNLTVLKTFTPDLSGDFTGGLVNVKTKEFGRKESLQVGMSLGYNPAMNLKSNYLDHYEGIGDYLGFGNAHRRLPLEELKVPVTLWATNPEKAENVVNQFSKKMASERFTSGLNSSFTLSAGNQFENEVDSNGAVWGYNLAFGYSNTTTYYADAKFQTYIRDEDKSVNELVLAEKNNGEIGGNEVLWSALANGSYKKGLNILSMTLFHTQNGVKKTSLLAYENIANPFGDAGARLDKTALYYNQRTLSSMLLKHVWGDVDTAWKFTTKFSPSFSTNNEPDMRLTYLSPDEGGYRFNVGAGSEVSRLYRALVEFNGNLKVDAEKSFNLTNKRVTKVKFGLANTYKNRDFGVLKYFFQAPSYNLNFNGDPNQIFDEYLFNADTREGFYAVGEPIKANQFNSSINIAAVYAMHQYPLTDKLEAIYGVRIEKADMNYTGENTQNVVFNNQKVLDELNVLPSLNLIYRVTPYDNIRLSGTKTLARPSFKEKSLAQILDPINGRTFIGNLDLEQTEVTNFDFAIEHFMKPGELISVSTFYKHFVNPIEIVVYKPETPTNFTARNAESGSVYGLEFEFRKAIWSSPKKLKQLFYACNSSYFISVVKMNQQEIEGKTNEARVGQEIGTTREMQGQAPYIINSTINYRDKTSGLNTNLSYNVQGPKLAIVGIGRLPDVYTESFHSLNFKASRNITKKQSLQMSVAVNNILGDDNLQVYRGYEAQDQIFTMFRPQRTFKVGFSYKIK